MIVRVSGAAEAFDQRPVTLNVCLGDVVERPASLSTSSINPTTAVVVVLVLFEVLGEMRDRGEDGDLDLGEPVSPSLVAYSSMIFFFVAASI